MPLLLSLAALLISAAVWAQRSATAPIPVVERVTAIGMVVADMDRSMEFYSHVLTFQKLSDVEVFGDPFEHLEGLFGVRMRVVQMRLGDETIELIEFLAPQGRPIPVDSHSNDTWFQHIAIITSDMDRAYRVLRDNKVRHASTAPQTLPTYIKSAAGIRAFYFRDPDSHFLELLEFPPDKGDSKWHAQTSKLFLGIDHTAIVVADTNASLGFYRDALGMRVTGESENYGTEQEHLNNVFGARLRITSLRAAAGPGIELLEYITPRDGRPIPPDTHADDLWAWQNTLSANNASAMAEKLRLASAKFIFSSVIELPDSALGFTRGFVVQDPDGHRIRLIQN
jgi:catechol 2,3-dioxygenase-like lactoylglutathione lyase family enzyme